MLNLVTYSCLLVSVLSCAVMSTKFDEQLELEIPENCSISTSTIGDESVHYMTCPDFKMTMTDTYRAEKAVNSVIDCSPTSLPYKYLPHMNSKRNALELENCQLPETSFGDAWPHLEHLSFSNVEMVGPLQREHFSGLNNLWDLTLQVYSVHEMPDDVFADVGKLRNLVLSVKIVNKNAFRHLRELETLGLHHISEESLSNFDTNGLIDAPKFKNLWFYGNTFTHLTKQFFVGCSKIEFLGFTECRIDAIDGDAFEPLTNLKSIDISGGSTLHLPAFFSTNKKLEKVKIMYSDLGALPAGFLANLPKLREIEIYFCNLTSIPNDLIHGSNNLESLRLQYNQLTTVPRDLLRNHTKLKEIRLYGNQFVSHSRCLPEYHFYDKSPSTKIYCDD